MFCSLFSATILGVSCVKITVEADVAGGLPNFSMVGLLSSEVREARERVRSAIVNSGFEIASRRITVNLSPADIKKEGSGFDFAIAICVLSGLGYVNEKSVENTLFVGELGLDGKLKKVNGVLPMAILAKEENIERIIIPKENVTESSLVTGIEIIGVESLKDVVSYLNKEEVSISKREEISILDFQNYDLDFSDIKGQKNAKRAAEIAAAGRHNLLLMGPPGSGKTMISKRIPSIIYPLSKEEILEVAKIYSIMGIFSKENMKKRPFREPSNSITLAGMVGGKANPKPGEITLAHKGVLFLDEFPEFKREVVEALRLPLEEKVVRVSRSEGNYVFPADFMLVAAMNPCHCGYFPDRNRCKCSEHDINKYQAKVNGPIMDRIDLCAITRQVDITRMDAECKELSEDSKTIRERVNKATKIQQERYKDENFNYNSELTNKKIYKYCMISERQSVILRNAVNKMNMSARAYYKVLKVARTIADLAGEEKISEEHLLEALSFRMK